MKTYTDLEQSNKLAEILPLESADMYWFRDNIETPRIYPEDMMKNSVSVTCPCWSLTALMDVLDCGALFKTPQGWAYQTYTEYKIITGNYHNNPVDACIEIISELHEQKLL